jgi:hypothetical protein
VRDEGFGGVDEVSARIRAIISSVQFSSAVHDDRSLWTGIIGNGAGCMITVLS